MNDDTRAYRVWDLPIRIFHWSIVILVVLQFATGQYGLLDLGWHFRFGYAVLTLIGARLLWGLCGSSTARFANFLAGPARIGAYLKGLRDPARSAAVGHNPLGGWSVMAMLLSLAVQAATGLFITDDIDWMAPLSGRVSAHLGSLLHEIHETNAYVLLGLILLHVLAIYYYVRRRGETLVRPMLVGTKVLARDPGLRFVSPWLALVVLIAVAVAVWRLVVWGEAS